MSSKLVLVSLLGAGTIAAATAGGYVALRRNAQDSAAAVAASEIPVETSTGIVETPRQADGGRFREATSAPLAEPAGGDLQAIRSPASPLPAAPRRPAETPRVASAPASVPSPAAASTQPSPEASSPPTGERANEDTREPWTEPAPAPVYEPAKPQVEELTVAPDSVIGIRLESSISSESAQVEDKVTARVTRDVTVGGRTAIASGARLDGVVASVERGGKFKNRARIGLRFQSLVLADGTRLPIETETIFRESDSPTGEAASKVGASAAVGGILGAVLGGKKGAAIGATVGAAGGSGAVMAGSPATTIVPAGTSLTVRLTEPVTVRVQRED